MLAQASAASAAASSTVALPVSVVRKSRSGCCRLRAQAVRPPNPVRSEESLIGASLASRAARVWGCHGILSPGSAAISRGNGEIGDAFDEATLGTVCLHRFPGDRRDRGFGPGRGPRGPDDPRRSRCTRMPTAHRGSDRQRVGRSQLRNAECRRDHLLQPHGRWRRRNLDPPRRLPGIARPRRVLHGRTQCRRGAHTGDAEHLRHPDPGCRRRPARDHGRRRRRSHLCLQRQDRRSVRHLRRMRSGAGGALRSRGRTRGR